ncbi:transketolase [Tepidamorphus gemmatus]|uniref:Transketolase n=1 Tax=Tepidamorphus gemmatus TaxID=747076 RepID=A0A4V2V000_9HYPH|nr:transketolase [Tepidamorphus gemmatus]TCT13319.1 transketolase [Tepidamorphus gemmatus]
MTEKSAQVDHRAMANAIRALAMDAVEAAKSGHPGMPMGAADIATVLFSRFLKFDPKAPDWADRDRFVLSAGHGSMLLYAVLHLLGYEQMTIEELKRFRQLGSRTPGHPEYGHAPGVETTTGPLGQGLATAVGMAIAERHLNAEFSDDLVDHRTYVLAGDGDLMEGVSHEAIGLAGHLKLSRLIVLYDDNSISIDGALDLAESGDALKRFEAAGWHAVRIDGHDPEAIAAAIEAAQESDRPSLIACRTIIGYGAPNKQGTAATHGAPLGAEEVAGARKALDWPYPPFEIPSAVRDAWRIAGLRSGQARRAWEKRLAAVDRERRGEFERRLRGELPVDLATAIREIKERFAAERPDHASRKASEMVLSAINPVVPDTVGGSADLTGSNNTLTPGLGIFSAKNYAGRYIHYGVREHGMAAAMNGMALHGGVIPYGGTFLVFSDYSRPAIRLAALMGIRVIHVMTHDSIGLGEDGPTHQPVEHLASLRAMPNLLVMRPADAMETAECWQLALESRATPSVIALTRQNLPAVRHAYSDENLCARGAYELVPASGNAMVTVFASGSEVSIAIAARSVLEREGVPTRVVSVPCFELFEAQPPEYRRAILEGTPVRVAVEAAVGFGWERFLGRDGGFVGMTGFGASAPYKQLYEHFGITADAVVAEARRRLAALDQAIEP